MAANIASMIILDEDKVLMGNASDHLYFPGVDVSEGSGIELSMRRGMVERYGMKLLSWRFIGAVEALFSSDLTPFYQILFAFDATIEGYTQLSAGDWESLIWVPVSELNRNRRLTPTLPRAGFLPQAAPHETNRSAGDGALAEAT